MWDTDEEKSSRPSAINYYEFARDMQRDIFRYIPGGEGTGGKIACISERLETPRRRAKRVCRKRFEAHPLRIPFANYRNRCGDRLTRGGSTRSLRYRFLITPLKRAIDPRPALLDDNGPTIALARPVMLVPAKERPKKGARGWFAATPVRAILIESFIYLFFFFLPLSGARFIRSGRRSGARARARFVCPLRGFFSSPVRTAAIAAVRESHNGADTTSDSSWHRRRQPGGGATRPVSAECNSPKTMHRVKMARIDNPLPSRSIPRTRIIHTCTRPRNRYSLAGLALFLAGGKERGGGRVPGGGSEDWQ